MCYILEKFGYQTAFVDTQGYDVIVNYKKRPIRIQVKSALSRDYNRKKGGKPRYNFATNIGGEKRKYTKVGVKNKLPLYKLLINHEKWVEIYS